MLCEGNYMNLYDIVYDKPESHVIQKGDQLYYAFYADKWQGPIELRGLSNQKYKVFDYDNQVDMGTITGPVGTINPTFSEHLLIECTPLK
jgi:alpha-galactosidase